MKVNEQAFQDLIEYVLEHFQGKPKISLTIKQLTNQCVVKEEEPKKVEEPKKENA